MKRIEKKLEHETDGEYKYVVFIKFSNKIKRNGLTK